MEPPITSQTRSGLEKGGVLDTLRLYCDGELLREFRLEASPLEIGRASGCDIVLHDSDIADRQLLVQRQHGTVIAYDLQKKNRPKTYLPFDQPLVLNRRYQLVRTAYQNEFLGNHEHDTAASAVVRESLSRSILLIGKGNQARRVSIKGQPVQIGTDPSNDVVLHDNTVSRFHCRIEPTPCALRVRDLESRNGTFINGVRVFYAEVAAGSMLHVGHTDLPLRSVIEEGMQDVVVSSAAMERTISEVERFAPLSWPVLICGPSGVGKEVLGRVLHRLSSPQRKAWVAINAGGLPRELLESELFGHERGAFTGAHGTHKGAFERAHGGTLFLDEIGELPLEAQARLLRVVETWEVQRVGGERPIPVDVRLVCATHRDLARMVAEGAFREDLYYRLARLVVHIPPLKERIQDIEPLSQHFLQSMRHEIGPRTLSPQAVDQLKTHPWPGNVRELRNVLALAAVSSGTPVLDRLTIAKALERLHGGIRACNVEALSDVVSRHRGNLSAAARSLGMPRSTLRDRLAHVRAKS